MGRQHSDFDDYLASTGSIKAGGRSSKRKRATAAQKERSKKFWKRDNSPGHLLQIGETAAAALLRKTGGGLPRISTLDRRPRLDGALDPEKGAQERRDWISEAESRHRECRRQARSKGYRTWRFLLVLIPPKSLRPIGSLHESNLVWVKRTVQRWCRKLPPGSCVSGIIELVVNEDPYAAHPRAWIPHANLIVEVVAGTRKEAKKLVKAAFPIKPDPSLGIYAPYKTRRVYWMRGALRYASKGLQFMGVGRRFGQLDEEGYRKRTRKLPLKREDEAELAGFLDAKNPSDFVIRTGYHWKKQ